MTTSQIVLQDILAFGLTRRQYWQFPVHRRRVINSLQDRGIISRESGVYDVDIDKAHRFLRRD